MKIIFIGCIEFSEQLLKKLLLEEAEIVGIITKEESKFNADHVNLKPHADVAKIPCGYFADVNSSECISWVKSLKPDIIFCFGWSHLLKKKILDLPPMGVVGYHPTALPKNRGRHPSIWPLVLGLNETASTFFFMDEGADSGDILSQREVPITFDDDASDLYYRLIKIAKKQIEEYVPQLESGKYPRIKQDETEVNYWRKRGGLDGKIDFRMHSETIYNLVRGLTKPYVGAHIEYKGEDIKIWESEIGPSFPPNLEPGKILDKSDDDQLLVKTADGSIWLKKHEFSTLPNVNNYFI
jgi:methionyl-tRNA formyltransferase